MQQPTSLSSHSSRWLDLSFYLLLLLVIGSRVLLFLQLNLEFIDSDQPVMWLGAAHFSEGHFYEPRYYGQNYNTLLEGLLAVPFIWLGLPVYYAVPIVTYLLFLSPFLFTAIYLFRTGKKPQALLVLILLLCLPTGYDMMNAIPRGFVTGLFFTTPFILSIHQPRNLRYLWLNSFCAGLGWLVNQNSLLLSAPLLFYLFLHNYSSKRYYLYSLAALLCTLPFMYLLDHFYTVHPEYIQHPLKNHFSFSYFADAINNIDKRFAHINFFEDEKSAYLLLMLLLTAMLMFRENKKAFYAYLLCLCIVFISFFSFKTGDGVVWPFYSYSRMYLGIPLALGLFLSLLNLQPGRILAGLIAVTLIFTGYKELKLKEDIAYHCDQKKWCFIHLASLTTIFDLVDHYKDVCTKQLVNDFVVVDDIWCKSELCYGGPAIYKDFPNTLMTVQERRTWRIAEEQKRITPRFVLLSPDYDLDKKGFDSLYQFKMTRMDDYGCFLVEGNTRPLPEFLRNIGSPINNSK